MKRNAKWGEKWQTSNCHLSFTGVFFSFWSQLRICLSRPHILSKKPLTSCFRENVVLLECKVTGENNKDMKTGEIITYLWSNDVTALQRSLVSFHSSTQLLNSQRTKSKMSPGVQLHNKLNRINVSTEWERFHSLPPSPLPTWVKLSAPSCNTTDNTIVTV